MNTTMVYIVSQSLVSLRPTRSCPAVSVWPLQSLDSLEGVDLSLTQWTVVADVQEALHTEGDETAACYTPKKGSHYT